MSDDGDPRTGAVEHVALGDVQLVVRSWGPRDGRPVLFWHPLGDVTSGAYLTEMAPVLTASGLRLLAPDAPGFGASPALPPERYDVTRLAGLLWDLVAELVDDLEADRPVLLGHSWGGVVTLAAASLRPRDVAAVVLLDSGHMNYADRPGAHPERSLDQQVAAIEQEQPQYVDHADLVRQVQADVRRPLTDAYVAGLGPAVRVAADGRVEPVASARVRAAARHGMQAERSLARWEPLTAADVPVLLVLATEPETVRVMNEEGARAVRERHPGADVVRMAGLGHDLVADGGPAVAATIAEWLAAGRGRQRAASASTRSTSRTDGPSRRSPRSSTR